MGVTSLIVKFIFCGKILILLPPGTTVFGRFKSRFKFSTRKIDVYDFVNDLDQDYVLYF